MFRLLASLPRRISHCRRHPYAGVVWLFGLIAHAVMRDRGFGVIGNGALIMVGAAAGFYAGSLYLWPL